MGKLSAGSTGGIDMRYLLAAAFILSLGVTGADAAQWRRNGNRGRLPGDEVAPRAAL
jgi:hypothetical protein